VKLSCIRSILGFILTFDKLANCVLFNISNTPGLPQLSLPIARVDHASAVIFSVLFLRGLFPIHSSFPSSKLIRLRQIVASPLTACSQKSAHVKHNRFQEKTCLPQTFPNLIICFLCFDWGLVVLKERGNRRLEL
jgi:hypothetical protein